ncbi:MAG: hypothetical protein ACREPL_15455, partial [Rhodanobacteraceae bacterium]
MVAYVAVGILVVDVARHAGRGTFLADTRMPAAPSAAASAPTLAGAGRGCVTAGGVGCGSGCCFGSGGLLLGGFGASYVGGGRWRVRSERRRRARCALACLGRGFGL